LYYNNKIFIEPLFHTKNKPIDALNNKINKLYNLLVQLNSFDDLPSDGSLSNYDNSKFNKISPEYEKISVLIKSVKLYCENSLNLFNNDYKECSQYIDILHDQRINIYNIINSFIITMPSYEKYDLITTNINNISNITNEIFDILSNKCANQSHNNGAIYIDFDKYKYPTAPKKDFKTPSSSLYNFSNSNSFEQY